MPIPNIFPGEVLQYIKRFNFREENVNVKTVLLDLEGEGWKPHDKFPGLFVKPFLSGEEGFGFKTYAVKVTPGGEIPRHTHDVTEVFLFYKGNGESFMNGKIGKVSAGTVVAAPAGDLHGFVNTSDEDVIILANFEA